MHWISIGAVGGLAHGRQRRTEPVQCLSRLGRVKRGKQGGSGHGCQAGGTNGRVAEFGRDDLPLFGDAYASANRAGGLRANGGKGRAAAPAHRVEKLKPHAMSLENAIEAACRFMQ